MDDEIIDDKDDALGTAVARAQKLKQGEEEIGILTRPLRAQHLTGARMQGAGEIAFLVFPGC